MLKFFSVYSVKNNNTHDGISTLMEKTPEALLVERANDLKKKGYMGWISVQINLSQLKSIKGTINNSSIVNVIQQTMKDPNTEVYFCADNDVFVLCKNPKKESVDKFFQEIKFLFADDPLVHEDGGFKLARLYDFSVSFEDWFMVCNQKLVQYRQRRQELDNKERELSTTKGELINLEFDPQIWTKAIELRRSRPAKSGVENISILLIEDHAFSRQLMKETIAQDYVTYAAKDGKEGVELYMEYAPDIVFLDIELPDVNGFSWLEAITRQDPQAFIVMTTANNSEAGVRQALQKGAKGYIVKPFTRQKVAQYIELYLKHVRGK